MIKKAAMIADRSTETGRRENGALMPDFGSVALSAGQKAFYGRFNRCIIDLCGSLPPSVRIDALLFFTQYAGLPIGAGPDFFVAVPWIWATLGQNPQIRFFPA